MAIQDFLTRLTKNYTRWYICLAAALGFTLLAYGIYQFQFVQEIELKTLDYRFVRYPVPEKVDDRILLVDIDNNSLEYFMDVVGIQYPFPRNFYAVMTDLFTDVGARAVMFDMLFYDPDLNREETYAAETDGQFARAIAQNDRVSLGLEFLVDSSRATPPLARFAVPVEGRKPEQSFNYTGALVPIDTLLHAAKSLGVTNIRTDPDGVVRRIRLLHEYRGQIYPNLAFSGWLMEHPGESVQFEKEALRVGATSIPVDEHGNYLVNWYGPGGPDGVFRYYPISAVIQTAASGDTTSLDPGIFHDKFVIIGASASGLKDLKPTPFTGDYSYPGMEIWATVLSNVLQGDFVARVPWWLNFLNTALVCFLTIFLFPRLRLRYNSIAMMFIIAYIVALPLLVWRLDRIWLQMTFPAAGFVGSYVFIALVSFMVEGKSKMELRKVFTRYVHPDVIQNLMEHPDLIQLGGDEIYATVMFTDIYDFTTFSEGKAARELVRYLNQYFNTLTGFVLDYNGLLDKYTGDGIMAIFGAPVPREDHASLACQAALAHRKYSEALTELGKDSRPSAQFHLNTRIGLNSGYIVAGNIGSERRTDYTAVGDDVNLAARLEGVNKIFKTKIILSESTYRLVAGEFICRELDMLRVKGKERPVKIYELIDDKSANVDYDFSLIHQYHEGLQAYRSGDWQTAMQVFGDLANGVFQDQVSNIMYRRCEVLSQQELSGWDGVYTLETK